MVSRPRTSRKSQHEPPAPPRTSSAAPGEPQVDWLAEFPPPRSLRLDQEALRIYEHAYAIGVKVEEPGTPPVTFSTVLAALLVGEDETSRWFADKAAENGPSMVDVFAEKKLVHAEVVGLRPRAGKPESIQISTDRQLLTASASAVVQNAERWALKVKGSDIGVRHLVAAYILNPPSAHRAQMKRWKYKDGAWRPAFFSRVAGRYTAEQWADASYLAAPAKSLAEFEQKLKGEELAFPGDAQTIKILENAARFHARGSYRWLRLQTVYSALVETAREDPKLQAAIKPVWDAVAGAEPTYSRARDGFFPAAAQPNPPSFSALELSPRALHALEVARELALALANRHGLVGDIRVDALHLAGAIVSRRVDGDADLTAMGFKPQELRMALIDFAHQRGESADVWRDVLGEEEMVQAGRPVDLNSDEPESVIRLDQDWVSDPLGIRRDVETFAALIASKNLEPPLSIGLFGPWGSGKTTFLRRLQRAVQRRADEAKADQGESPYVREVVHVDFNAWQYSEGALTSSFVDTIFRALSAHIKDDRKIRGIEWKKQKLDQLESTKRKVAAATALEETARTAVGEAENKLTDAKEAAAGKLTDFTGVVRAVWTATQSALKDSKVVKESGVLDSFGDTISSAEELRARAEAIRARPARLLGDLGWKRSLIFAGLLLAVPPLVGWLVAELTSAAPFTNLLSATTATLSVIGVWFRAASEAASKVDKAVTQVADEYAKQLQTDKTIAAAQKTLDAAEAKAATAATELQAAREELARAHTELANAKLPAQMLQLLSGRLQAQSYSRELTTFSLARADLESLALLLRDQTEEQRSGHGADESTVEPGSKEPRAVDRVILYVDDLDRCKPEEVVRVLQMVHMLLAFELFIVVVAVDARWVEEALRQSYKWLSDTDDTNGAGKAGAANDRGIPSTAEEMRVTPQDYLEKIFQIAFWLEPMDSNRAARYLGSLVPMATRQYASDTGATAPPVAGTGSPAPTVTKVAIEGIELDYMRVLSAYVGSSPRRVKRLVNAYRLIKAGMSDAQLATFLTNRAADDGGIRSGPYQIVIGLLVIATGGLSASSQILKQLSQWDPTATLDSVVERFRAQNQPEWTMAAKVLETVMRSQKVKNVSELRGWARKVGRFLLNRPASDQLIDNTAAQSAQGTTP